MIRIAALLAAAAVPARAVTLVEAVELALENRGDVRSAALEAEAAAWDRRSADLWFLPSVSMTAAFVRNHDITVMEIPGMGSVPMGSEYVSSAGVTASVPLFTARGIAGSGLARAAEDLARIEAGASRQDAALQVIQAFYGVLLTRELDAVAQEALETSRAGYEIARQRFEAGTISRFELLQSQVAWENRRPEALAAASARDNAAAAFSVAMGFDGSTAFEVEGALEDPLPVDLPETLEEARLLMADNSTELARAATLREVGRASERLAGAAFAPSVILSTDYGFQASREDWEFAADDYERSWSTSLVIQVPIFDQLGDMASYNSARAGRLASEAGAGSLEDFAGLDLTRAWNDLAGAREAVEASSATVAQAEEGASIAAVSYEAGIITRLEMDQALLALTASRTNHANALYQLRTAEAGLARAMGLLVLE